MSGDEVGSFLAHAIALEDEAAERYSDLADTMDTHNNGEVAALFRQMAEFSRRHADSVRERAVGVEVPERKPWELMWSEPEGPETAPVERTHYLMTPYHCLQLALHNERRGHAYYADQAAKAGDADVRRMAEEMAAEEAEHVRLLEEWVKTIPEPEPDWDQDLDPPTTGD